MSDSTRLPEGHAEESGPPYSFDEAKRWDDTTVRRKLARAWGADLAELWLRGVALPRPEKPRIWRIHDVTGPDGKYLSYPIREALLNDIRSGIDLGNPLQDEGFTRGCILRFKLRLASIGERNRQRNPLAVEVDPATARVVLEIPQSDWIQTDDGLIIDRTVVHWIALRHEAEIERGLKDKREALALATASLENLAVVKAEQQSRVEEARRACEALANRSHELEREIAEKESLMAEQDRLLEFVRSRAEWLRKVGWLTDDQFRRISGEPTVVHDERPSERFDIDLGGNWPELVRRVQRHLLREGEFYCQRSMLESFLALLQTHDFVILAGLSGSGKTALVKSVARAIGAKAEIVPVKPNWASADDLLGYYNSLDHCFIKSPFLEILDKATDDPDTLYLVCLDEMNLARVEYYLADFLSALEEREKPPSISLASADQRNRLTHDLRVVTELVEQARKSNPEASFERLVSYFKTLRSSPGATGLTSSGDGTDSNAGAFHDWYTKMGSAISTGLDFRSDIAIPSNIRLIGAINSDESTFDLSPKVLDRAHVLWFDSPLSWIEQVEHEVAEHAEGPTSPVWIRAPDLGPRCRYPALGAAPELVNRLKQWNEAYLEPLDIPVGLRTIRQAILYRERAAAVGMNEGAVLDHIVRQKILPRMTFDGKTRCRGAADESRDSRAKDFQKAVERELAKHGIKSKKGQLSLPNAATRLLEMIERAAGSDAIYSFWV